MDKAEAIKILKDFHDKSALFSIRTALETLHPELKESEDKEIREQIVYAINKLNVPESEKNKLLAWLENIPYTIDHEKREGFYLGYKAGLEKQGEKQQKTPIWKHWKDGIAGNGEGKPIYLIKYGHTYSLSSCLCFECDYIKLSELDKLMLEKQETSYTKKDVDDAYVEGMAFAKNELEKQGNSPIKWNKNTEGNKPQVNHSVLMKTTHGIAEGEWKGEYWHQYRWAGIVRDSDVLSWMELSCLEKQGEQRYLVGADLGDLAGDKGCSFDYSNATIQQKDFALKEVEPRYEIGDVLCDKSCTTLDKNTQPNIEVTDIRNGMYICDKGCFPISQQDEYELVAKRIEQKPAWSEEDEEHYKACLQYFDEVNPDMVYYKDYQWLKSLKQRIGG